ncbi:MAG: thioredoxin family protein [Alphaproteobacteria bacterium]|nr:thioredoxin family protein [Alphaproteobacteria bacterium]
MRSIFAAFTMLLALCVPISASASYMREAKLIAVYFYADWCGYCKIMSRRLSETKKLGRFDGDVLFVTMDFTNPARIDRSTRLAESIGIDGYVRHQGSAVGYVALLDAASKSEIIRLDSGDSTQAMLQTIREELE